MTSRPEKGATAPDISLPATPGDSVNLGKPDRRGHVVFFYPKDNTSGCTTEATDFTTLQEAFEALDVGIIGVSRDSLKSHENFRAKRDLNMPLASDEDGTACESFGVWVEKQMYGKKYMGIERSTFLIAANGDIIETWRKVRVKGHAQSVLDATEGWIEG